MNPLMLGFNLRRKPDWDSSTRAHQVTRVVKIRVDQNVKGTTINSIQTRIHPELLQVKAVNTTTCFSPFSYIFQVHCMTPD